MSAAIRGPVVRDLREQTGQDLTAHHHRGNNRTQESLSAKAVLRAGGTTAQTRRGPVIEDAQRGWEINVHISEANNVFETPTARRFPRDACNSVLPFVSS